MQVTFIGLFLIPLGGLLFLLKPDLLFYLFVFFVPFSDSSVINIVAISYGLTPAYWFGLLWMLHRYFDWAMLRRSSSLPNQKTFFINLFVIWAVCSVSLFMPALLEGQILVHNPEVPWHTFVRLEFGRINITQLLYLTFSLLISCFTLLELEYFGKLIQVIKVLFISTYFVLGWGLFQIFCFYSGVSYPMWLFNNRMGSYQSSTQVFLGGLKRINSVAPEPSMLALFLLGVFAFILPFYIYNNRSIMNKWTWKPLLYLTMITLVLSTSTTAYAGLITFLFLMLFHSVVILTLVGLRKESVLRCVGLLKMSALFLFLMICCFIFIKLIKDVPALELLRNVVFEKQIGISGQERWDGFIEGLRIFAKAPILGVGWGSNRTFDLMSNILSNVGILGGIAFFMMLKTLRRIYLSCYGDSTGVDQKVILLGVYWSILASLIAYFIAVPDIAVFPLFWFLIGALASLPRFCVKMAGGTL